MNYLKRDLIIYTYNWWVSNKIKKLIDIKSIVDVVEQNLNILIVASIPIEQLEQETRIKLLQDNNVAYSIISSVYEGIGLYYKEYRSWLLLKDKDLFKIQSYFNKHTDKVIRLLSERVYISYRVYNNE